MQRASEVTVELVNNTLSSDHGRDGWSKRMALAEKHANNADRISVEKAGKR